MGNQQGGGGGGGGGSAPTAGLDCNTRCPGTPQNDPNQNDMLVGCGPIGTVANYVQCPPNEWESVGESSQTCTYATGQPGCFLDCRPGSACDGQGNCSATGKQLRCRRKNGADGYQADKTQCCLRGVDSINGKTCDPNYRDKRSALCQQELATYCAQGNNMFSNDCKTWALGDGKGNPEADAVINEVCRNSANANRPECACLVAANKLAANGLSASIPIGCSGTGPCAATDVFKTTQMRNQDCVLVDCTVKDIQLLKSQVKGIQINQVCSGNTAGLGTHNNANGAGSSLGSAGGSVGSSSMSTTTRNLLIAGGIVTGLALVGGILALTVGRRKHRFPSYRPPYEPRQFSPQQRMPPQQLFANQQRQMVPQQGPQMIPQQRPQFVPQQPPGYYR